MFISIFVSNNTWTLIWPHDDVIKWKHFPRYWPFVRGIHRSPVNSSHKGQRRGALMFSLISAQINGWANNREAGDLRRIRLHYDVTVMLMTHFAHSSHKADLMKMLFISKNNLPGYATIYLQSAKICSGAKTYAIHWYRYAYFCNNITVTSLGHHDI